MSPLKPCPFCGGADPRVAYIRATVDHNWHSIECMACGAMVNGPTEADAITAWNTRTDTNSDLLEALEPFAKASEIRLCGGDHWTDDKWIQGTDISFHISFGDLRRARTAIAKYRALIEEQG